MAHHALYCDLIAIRFCNIEIKLIITFIHHVQGAVFYDTAVHQGLTLIEQGVIEEYTHILNVCTLLRLDCLFKVQHSAMGLHAIDFDFLSFKLLIPDKNAEA